MTVVGGGSKFEGMRRPWYIKAKIEMEGKGKEY